MRQLALSIVVLFLAGCASKPPPQAAPPANPAPEAPPPAAAASGPGSETTQSNVSISEDIRKACGLAYSETFFAYDSSMVRSQDRTILKKLAECFSTGPLKGKQMRVVGHADSRGDADYNYVLGQRRADNVKAGIVAEGMKAEGIGTTSRGENDAVGTDEAGWGKDRRVDIVLGG
jgi:peptidoglycan-associated lipoprotein